MRAGAEATSLLAQRLGQHEIRHVVEGEGQLQAFGGDAARREQRAGVVDERVDARLARHDLAADPARFGDQREVGDMGAMAAARRDALERGERRLGPLGVARDEDDARAHRRQFRGGDFADARRRACRDHRLALHEKTHGSIGIAARRLCGKAPQADPSPALCIAKALRTH